MQIADKAGMPNGTVVLIGSLRTERLALDPLASEFGFAFKEVPNLLDLAGLNLDEDLVAVLFCPDVLGLQSDEALRRVLGAAPGALPILCHGFANQIDWPTLVDAGAFHSLLMPFHLAEVRQSLGFVWGARHSWEAATHRKNAGAEGVVIPGRLMATGMVA